MAQGTITYVVTIRVLYERERVVCDLVNELDALVLGRVVDAALKHTAAVAVGGDLDAIVRDGVVDELVVLGRELVETLLDDVVSVKVFNQHNYVQAERNNDRVYLFIN